MIEFIDKTSTQGGTPINRKNLMAIQGFESKTTVFNSDGSITERNSNNEVLTIVFESNGSIIETLKGNKTLVKTTTFNSDGTISETIK